MNGLWLALVAAALAIPSRAGRRLAGSGAAVGGLGVAAARMAPPPGPVELTLGALAALAVLAAWLGRREDRPEDPGCPPPPASPPSPTVLAGAVAGALLAALASSLYVIAAGALLAVAAAGFDAARAGQRVQVFCVASGGALLVGGIAFLITRLGPLGPEVAVLDVGPVSPAAERLAGLAIGLGALLVIAPAATLGAGSRGALLAAPAAAAVLARAVTLALPAGTAQWQHLFMPLLLVALWVTAGRGRLAEMLLRGGLFAMWAGVPRAIVAGGALIGLAALGSVLRALGAGRGIAIRPLPARLLGLLPAWIGLVALEETLRVEVTYSVAAVLGVALFAARPRD